MNESVLDRLLYSNEPSIRFKVLVNVLGRDPNSAEMARLQQEIRVSPRVGLLLSERDGSGRIPYHPYTKWYGAHWVLASLADIDYPSGDESLVPLREQVYEWLFSGKREKKIRPVEGRVRICASQDGNALYYLLRLGLADARTEKLVERLTKWQWPDGGWNCDKKPDAVNSSFMESLIPLRGLALYAKLTDDRDAKKVAERAAEIFLKRRLFRRQRDGEIISDRFVTLHYPCYWHYDILFGLKVMVEAGFIGDERCTDALELLESKRLADGGFPAEGKYYRVTEKRRSGRSLVNWGGTSKKHMNEFTTTDAFYVLKESGRLDHNTRRSDSHH